MTVYYTQTVQLWLESKYCIPFAAVSATTVLAETTPVTS